MAEGNCCGPGHSFEGGLRAIRSRFIASPSTLALPPTRRRCQDRELCVRQAMPSGLRAEDEDEHVRQRYRRG